MTGEVGTVYTLHFDRRIGADGRNGAQHYVGWARGDGQARIAHHRRGTSGVPLVEYAIRQGIGFMVADLRPGTRSDERRLKNRGHHDQRCTVCLGTA
jgi:hypothetical protein